MTVQELIKELQELPPDTTVIAPKNWGLAYTCRYQVAERVVETSYGVVIS